MKVGDIVNVKGRLWKTKTVYRRSIHHTSSRPEKALYLGVSYLNEGEVVWGGENEPNYLHVTNRIKVAVLQRIGGNKYYRPFYALPSDVVDAAIEARHVEVHAFADELAAMDADLAALRAQVVEPVAKMTDEQLEQIEAEHIGAEHSAKPFLY